MAGIVYDQIDTTVVTPALRMETKFNPANMTNLPTRVLVIGTMKTGAAATPGTVIEPATESEMRAQVGGGSIAARMWQEAKKRWKGVPVAILPLAEPTGAKALGTITFAGDATEDGSVDVQIGDNVIVNIPYAMGDDHDDLAAAVAAELTAGKHPDLMAAVTVHGDAAAQNDVEFLTKGTLGNELQIKVTFRESAGLSATVVQPTGGTGDVDLADHEAAIKAANRKYLAFGVADDANGAIAGSILDDLWNGMTGKPSMGAMGSVDTYANLLTLSAAVNAKHLMIVASPKGVTPSWVRAAGAIAMRARTDSLVAPADAMQWKKFTGWQSAFLPIDRLSGEEVNMLLKRGVTPCAVDGAGVDCIVCDVWSEHKDENGAYMPYPQFMTFSGILALRHTRVLARWNRSRLGAANWGKRVVTEPKNVTIVIDDEEVTIMQSEQSKAFALQMFQEDKAMEADHLLNYVTKLGFENYVHQVISYETGQIGVSANVYPAPPLLVINGQQISNQSPPESEEA